MITSPHDSLMSQFLGDLRLAYFQFCYLVVKIVNSFQLWYRLHEFLEFIKPITAKDVFYYCIFQSKESFAAPSLCQRRCYSSDGENLSFSKVMPS